jgi:uncharacterized membrane protein YbhN (UPF0104 family)
MLLFLRKFATPGFRKIASVAIVIATLLLFAYYAHDKPELLDGLRSVDISTGIALLALYGAILLTNTSILHWSVEACSRAISHFESLLLTSYSSLVNFFGPLQSGPGFRLLYLKKKHDVSVKSYGTVTILYYGVFGLASLLLIGFGINPLLAMIGLAIILFGAALGGWYVNKRYKQLVKYPLQIGKITVMTLLQVAVTVLIYYLELHVVDKDISFSQALIYTGTANLALFVALTPGALGIRESFLFFSQHLHHISSHTIIEASVIDRGVYFIFLGILFVFSASFNIGDRLKKQTKVGL